MLGVDGEWEAAEDTARARQRAVRPASEPSKQASVRRWVRERGHGYARSQVCRAVASVVGERPVGLQSEEAKIRVRV